MAVRYVEIGQYPDVRREVRGNLSDILVATANPGTFAMPEDVPGCFLEMGLDGLWTGASVGTLTQVEADALVASGAMATVKVGTPGTVAGTLVRYGGAVGWVADEVAVNPEMDVQSVIDANIGRTIKLTKGVYKLHSLNLPAKTHLIGEGAYGYPVYADAWSENPTYINSVTVVENIEGYTTENIFNSIGDGCVISGIAFRTSGGGPNDTRKFIADEIAVNHLSIDRCLFEGLAGIINCVGIAFGNWTLTRSQFSAMQGDVFSGAMVDMLITGNRFTSTNGDCIHIKTGGGFNLITNNRFEQTTKQHITIFSGRSNTISANLFDRAYGCGVRLLSAEQTVVVGNLFWRNGYNNTGDDVAHILLDSCQKTQSIIGNTFLKGVNDNGTGADTPKNIFRLKSQTKLVIYNSNCDDDGYSELAFSDNTSNTKCVSADKFIANSANANTASDDIVLQAANLAKHCMQGVRLVLREARKFNSYASTDTVTLESMTGIVSINAAAGSFYGMKHNLLFSGITWFVRSGKQYVSAKPTGYPDQGRVGVGEQIYLQTPLAGGAYAFVCTANATPDILSSVGSLA